MKWQEIMALFGKDSVSDLSIGGVAYDSRKVKTQDVFVCIAGGTVDGHDYAAKAVERGAVALVVAKELKHIPAYIPQLQVENTRLALAIIAEAYHDYPGKKLKLIGVTGTNGKTTVTHLVKEILDAAGKEAGLIGTNHILIGKEVLPTSNTTPESWEISTCLQNMVAAGCQYGVMEVSSHGLKQGRISALPFAAAAFTNLTQDHLDYHLDFHDYMTSKQILFKSLQEKDGLAVINLDDPYSFDFIQAAKAQVITYGLSNKADYCASDIAVGLTDTRFKLARRGETFAVKTSLLGHFNVYNALAVIAILEGQGLAMDFILHHLTEVKQVRGRFEKVKSDKGPTVIIDYAHTPDGLASVLRTAAAMKKGRLILVFGCGGDRDRTKRPIMGKIAGTMADFSFITSDNPRTEEPEAITAMIAEGIGETDGKYCVITDRRKAIAAAITEAKKDDLVIIAGKGHEDYQILGEKKVHFDDFEEAAKALKLYSE